MKNVFKFLGFLNRDRRSKVPLLIIALVAVIGFGFVSCGGDDDGGGGGGGGGAPATNGKLTITGLGSQNGLYIAGGSTKDLYAGDGIGSRSGNNSMVTGGKIANGTVTLKVWKISGTTVSDYSGNDTEITFALFTADKATTGLLGTSLGYVTVNFTGGVDSVTFTP